MLMSKKKIYSLQMNCYPSPNTDMVHLMGMNPLPAYFKGMHFSNSNNPSHYSFDMLNGNLQDQV
jgi:hypothetical protein